MSSVRRPEGKVKKGKLQMEKRDLTIERLIQMPTNQAICRFVSQYGPSAHPDDVEELRIACSGLPPHPEYCPNPQRHAYVIRYTNSDVIFAAVFGMNCLLFRLPQDKMSEAAAEGGHQFHSLPQEWVAFNPFPEGSYLDVRRKQLKRWCEVAYLNASKSQED